MSDHTFQQPSDESIDVLLVEDDPGDIRLTEEAFEAVDSETTLRSITDGDDAIDFLTRRAAADSASLPDFVIVDLNVPGSDGRAVLGTIRNDPALRTLPVIMLTGADANEDIERCYEAHANACLTKPDASSDFRSLAESVETFWFERVRLPGTAR